jgi:hypothetical protein
VICADHTHTHERDLWLAVIEQAANDALWLDRAPEKPITTSHNDEKRRRDVAAGVRARRWFLENGSDYQRVCDMAGVCPDATRATLKKLLAGQAGRIVEVG